MSKRGVDHLAKELSAVIERFRREYVMTYAEVVGCIELVKHDVVREASEIEE